MVPLPHPALTRTFLYPHVALGVPQSGQQVQLDARLGGQGALQVGGALLQRAREARVARTRVGVGRCVRFFLSRLAGF